jgi:hypothetical protein
MRFTKITSLLLAITIVSTILVSCGAGRKAAQRKAEVYMFLYDTMATYIEGQNMAQERMGTYMDVRDMERNGFVPGEWPRTNPEFDTYHEIVETNITSTTYTVEVRPIGTHFDSFGIQSLWADQTGVVRIGSLDGQEFEPVE